jgi:hypothetical protein
MKFLVLFAFFFAVQAYAVDICSYRETWSFIEALDAEHIGPTKVSRNHNRFTFVEKQMIHLTVTLQDWLRGSSREEALEKFQEDGEIYYYEIDSRKYAFVRYWQGDNEFGAYYEMTRTAYRLVAKIEDSFISCK